jgi:hypothetical protein
MAFCLVRLLHKNNAPTEPLSFAVSRFNIDARDSKAGALEPPLTENEVTSAIRTQLPNLVSKPAVHAIYQNILDTGRLPPASTLTYFDSWERTNVPKQMVWWINLNVEIEKDHFYGLRIRQNMNPVIAQAPPSK